MLKYIFKRIGLAIVSAGIIMTMLFVLIRLLPNPVVQVTGGYAQQLEDMRTAWGYYDPLIVQYGIFLKNVFTKFDWGFCTTVGTFLQPVTEYLVSKLPATLYVNLCSLIFSIPMGIIFGVIAAIFKNKWQDQIINVFIMIFISIPSFVYAVLLQYWVGFKLGWAPLVMSSGTDYFSWTMFHSAIMPILALSFSTIAGDMRMIRAELSETLTSEYMLLARTKGLTRAQATMRHAFRNSLVPIIQGIRDQKYIDEKVYEVLEKVGLVKEHASRYPHEFSGGQRQRIGIARAIIMNPDLIIADEPVSALDVSIQAQVINLLNELRKEMGLTILFIAHDLSVVKYFSHIIIVMYFGKTVEIADSDKLFSHPLHPYTCSLLSAIPLPDPHYEKQRKRIVYVPEDEHDYSMEQPTLREIAPGHFVSCNTEEFEKYRKKLVNA